MHELPAESHFRKVWSKYSLPDGYGYYCDDSKSLGGPTFDWEDGEWFSIVFGDDSIYPVPIGFNFTFYDRNFNFVTISSNGFISFSCCVAGCCNGQPIPSSDVEYLIAGWWTDLNPPEGGSIACALNGVPPYRFLCNLK
jgi:hypothetical protein